MSKMLKNLLLLGILILVRFPVQSQEVHIYYYDKTMHVVDVPDYAIHHQSEREHNVDLYDSSIVSFFYKRISELKEYDSVPQMENSLVKIVYVYENGNFDVLTLTPQSPYRRYAICKNGRMYHYDNVLGGLVLLIINHPDNYGNRLMNSIKKYILKNE